MTMTQSIETGSDTETTPSTARRSLMRGLGGTAAIASLATVGLLAETTRADAATYTDVDILNFALNFEYLGAEYYLRGISGNGLSANMLTGSGTQGTVSGGSIVPWGTSALQSYAQRLAVDELAHVEFLRAAITAAGSTPIAEPSINLSTAWTVFAQSAGLIVAGQTFDPFADPISFFLGAYVIEDVCVTALAGAAGLLTDKTNIAGAAGLLATEGYQAGMIRTILSDIGAGQATDLISNLRASLSGAADDFGTAAQGSEYNIVPNDINGLVFRRTPAQVLNVVYGGGAASNYGFFPNRVNGTIN